MMDKEDLSAKVDRIISMSGDDEVAHSEEDKLRLSVIRQWCPDWVIGEIERLRKADFERWCA